VKTVRIQAALAVASLKNLKLSKEQQKVLDTGIKDYISTMQYASDFPAGRYNLGLIYHAMGKTDKAVESYERAIPKTWIFFTPLQAIISNKGF
jgi:tetratricopeptide (TPR) repeat protein